MTFSAGRRRVASPFAQRAAQFASAPADAEETPDISTISDTIEPEVEAQASDAPVVLEEHPEAAVESNNQEVANEALDEAQEPTSDEETTDEPKRGRGRPRVAEVQERDERVLADIAANPYAVRQDIEGRLGMTQNEVYMSLYRLRTSGKIVKQRVDGKHAWILVEA